MRIGYGLSSEELPPHDMVRSAAAAEAVGFEACVVTDHYHPWIRRQGQSPFVWSVVGGILATTERIRVGTGVTCPLVRLHPAVVAQAAATAAVMGEGRFFLGVGTGEALNEHIFGDPWPAVEVRLEMLEEAIALMRQLWTGDEVTHRGPHYRVESARLYTCPPEPPPVMVSGFGPRAATLAGRLGDGYVGTSPAPDLVGAFEQAGGVGKPKLALVKVCWGEDEAEARELAGELWPTSLLPGQLGQDLPTVAHFEQAVQLVDREEVGARFSCGPSPDPFLDALRAYEEAGYDEVFLTQVGPDQDGFLRFWDRELRPALRERAGAGR